MKYGLELTQRDIKLLTYLKEQGVATADQITSDFFGTYGAFQKRVSYLIRSGLVESVPLSRGISCVPSRMIELRQNLSDRGKCWQKVKLYRLSKNISGKGSQFESPLSEPIYWQHQLGLNEIRAHLSKILSNGIFISDPESKAEWARFKFGSDIPIPDLVWRRDKIEFAIEYERTNKGEMKYFDRMARYSRSQYQRILFVANTDDIEDLLRKCSFRFPKVGITSKSSFNKVYVGISGISNLSEFLTVGVCNEARV